VEIEKVMTVAAPAAKVWDMLLDPTVMGGCVPGMKAIEVVSPTEYVALMHVKFSFVSAKFKLKTTVVEQRAPHYLRSEGTGEDASVASSLKQQSEVFLTSLADGRTELKMKVKVDVLGRLGSFGLSVMKTKADRMWEEFGQNLVARLEGGGVQRAAPVTATESVPVSEPATAQTPAPAPLVSERPTAAVADQASPVNGHAPRRSWLDRLLARGSSTPESRSIRIELKRGDTLITVHWPLEASAECAALLREAMR
jgi:carbon monoxide dehydrogenase subunit G